MSQIPDLWHTVEKCHDRNEAKEYDIAAANWRSGSAKSMNYIQRGFRNTPGFLRNALNDSAPYRRRRRQLRKDPDGLH
jgi:hypothetical protein